MKKIILCMLFMLVLSYAALAANVNPDRWVWRFSTDKQSIYSYNAPPEIISISEDKNYIEFKGYVLVILPYDEKLSHYKAKIRVGIKLKEEQMLIEYIEQFAYDKNNDVVKLDDPKTNIWRSVTPDTIEEGYGYALFEAFKEHYKAGSYNKEEPPKEATNKNKNI